ncbi:hypothetical protein BT69DRAFT_1257741 [Atractiella rhizophila]|nr:hypothetical protein BT69DRAFT_1257741 [Atractiella rhizophila]
MKAVLPLNRVCHTRCFSTSHVVSAIKTVGVVGAGQMGLGIAYITTMNAKLDVKVYDSNPASLKKSLAFMDKLLEKDVKKSKYTASDAEAGKERVAVVSSMEELHDADIIIEAVPEILSLKEAIFRDLAKHARKDTILATNTSSISISKIAAAAGPQLESSSRVLGVHFMNPVPQMPLVELIPALQTSASVLESSKAFAESLGKQTTISKDVPGFIANRILMPFINEAIITLETGVATKEDIDKTLILGMAHKMGPLTLADFIGLDTCLNIMWTLYNETADSKYRPSVLLQRMVDANWLGKKNGKGFYDYE